jgi:hypothetical protein
VKGGLTVREAPSVGTAWQPRKPPAGLRDENDVTLPIRIISSRDPQSGGSRKPRVSWFKKYEEEGVRRTPDFTEIGEQQA